MQCLISANFRSSVTHYDQEYRRAEAGQRLGRARAPQRTQAEINLRAAETNLTLGR